ncbi:hypothetical protein C121_27 [Stenotrophomonas phage C121]|uniref:hypothetical protein n=1 Tax=Stenotrophomonas phage C121 TaxID=2914029 RepID=UPI0023299200|nr:hypothetical protein PP752_gp27 [Stenotrophomonas phage C121]UKL14760.1 hypothetical protein C121_27 [Stenotrophomonas phage C121]
MTNVILQDADDPHPEFKDLPDGAFFRFTTSNSIYVKIGAKYSVDDTDDCRVTCVCVHAAIKADELGKPYYVGSSTRVIQINRVDIHL